jgi:hypothetical protein
MTYNPPLNPGREERSRKLTAIVRRTWWQKTLKPVMYCLAVVVGLLSLGTLSPDGAQDFVSVRIGWGCIDVPSAARVVETPAQVVDHHYGFIMTPDRPRVDWSFGLSEAHPRCHEKCKTIWQRTEAIGGRPCQVGLLQDMGSKSLFIVDQFISFRIDADTPEALAHLRNIAARYHRRERPDECRTAEKP